jgi:Dolichyl-phosphate-mannose-protein mannosyltransferase
MSVPTQKWKDAQLSLIILLSLGVNSFWLWWGLPNGSNTWAVDGIAPLEPLVAAKRMFIDDWWNSGYYNKYPMGHFFVLMAVYAPYILYLFVTGGIGKPAEVYPYGLSDPETALTVLTLIANGVSVLMGVGIVILIYLMARDLFGQRGACFSALIIAFSPAFIYYSHTANVDTPSLFWCALGLFAFTRLVQGKLQRCNYVLLGFAVGMAMATKEQVYGVFILLPFQILALHILRQQPSRLSMREVMHALFNRNILSGLGSCILTFVLASHLIFNWDGNLLRLNWRLYGIHPKWGENYPYSPLEVSGIFDRWQQNFWLLWDSMNPFLFSASVIGVVYFVFKERWARYFLVPLLSYIVFAMSMFPFLRARFVMEAVLVLALFGGRCLDGAWSWGSQRPKGFVAVLTLLWVYSFFYGFNVNYLMMRDARYKAEAWIQANVPAGVRVETYSPPTYLPRLSHNINSYQVPFTDETFLTLPERSPDYLLLTSAHYVQFKEHTVEKQLLARLLRGDLGYQPIGNFQTKPLLGPNLIPGLSPEIIILGKATDKARAVTADPVVRLGP